MSSLPLETPVGAVASVASAAAPPPAVLLPAQPSAAKVWMTNWLVPAVLPLVLLLAWDIAVRASETMLVPSPKEVGLMLWDFAFGGIYDEAFSATLFTHWWQSMSRVYGTFALAALVGIPLGLVIGKNAAIRRFVDPTRRCCINDYSASCRLAT